MSFRNKRNKKAFTLIELLAVIVILGIIMLIAIPSVTGYITASRKKTLEVTMKEYISIANMGLSTGNYHLYGKNYIYAIPIECLPTEKGGEDPFGEWLQANDNYWAYVLAQYDVTTGEYTYGFTFKDSAGNGMYPIEKDQIGATANQVKDTYTDLYKPSSGKAFDYLPSDKWTGFTLNEDTELVVLEAMPEGQSGDGKTTCTLYQKGSNYDEIHNSAPSSPTPVPPESLSFADASWDTIITAVREGKTENYHVGDTKEIDMGSFGKHTVRIANMSTPSECSSSRFSKTACGFVIEFADVVTKHSMNSQLTNEGGWPATKLNSYVNNEIYNALPAELREGIINTYVVSGHGFGDSYNLTSTDKLYLLSTKEVYGTSYTYDTLSSETRQLDYYQNIGVTLNNTADVIKEYNGITFTWWFRSPDRFDTEYFYGAYVNDGKVIGMGANTSYMGVSPAFRIG